MRTARFLTLVLIIVSVSWASDGQCDDQPIYICVENSNHSVIHGDVNIDVGGVVVRRGIFDAAFGGYADHNLTDNEGNSFSTVSDYSAGLRMHQSFRSALLGMGLTLRGGYNHQEYSVTNTEYAGVDSKGTLKRNPWFIEPSANLKLEFARDASFISLYAQYKYQDGKRTSYFYEHQPNQLLEFRVESDENQNSYAIGFSVVLRSSPTSDAFSFGLAYSGYENTRETIFKQIVIDYDPQLTEHPRAEIASTKGESVSGSVGFYRNSLLSGTLIQLQSGWERVESDIARDPLDPPFDKSVFFGTAVSFGQRSSVLEVGLSAQAFILDKEGYDLGCHITLLRHIRGEVNYGEAEFDSQLGVNEAKFEDSWLKASVIVSVFEI